MSEKEEAQKDFSYLHERLDPLGWTPALNVVNYPKRIAGDNQDHAYPLFDVDEHGDLLINYYQPNGAKATYKRANSNVSKDYQVVRYRVKRVRADGKEEKYKVPSGTGTIPWLPPNVIEAYNAGKHIETLVMTEGVIKSYAGYVNGVHMIGLPGIHNLKDKSLGTLHPWILQVIKTCTPKEVMFLHDGDCRSLSRKWPEEDPTVDLYEKPNSFFSSARNMGELLKDYARLYGFRTYYLHVASEAFEVPPKVEAPKGFDDLVLAYPLARAHKEVRLPGPTIRKADMDDAAFEAAQLADVQRLAQWRTEWEQQHRTACIAEIVEDLLSVSQPPRFFERRDLDRPDKLRDYFHLRSADTFYAAYQERIGDKEFVYDGTQYQWDEGEKLLKVRKPSIAKRYVRVGINYFKYVKKPNPHSQQLEEFLEKWSKPTIVEDHGKHFCEHVMKLEAFVNYPDHVSYQEIKNNCLNSYARFLHVPDPDAEPPVHTLKFLTHIFGNGTVSVPHPRRTGADGKPEMITVNELDLGLDYMKLLYEQPTQMLPIFCPVSKARGTGKTTFFDLLQVLFGANCTFISARDLESDFNYHYASKKIIIIDEALVSKRDSVEKLKSLSTAKQIMVNNKGVAQYAQAFFGVFLMGSNNVRDFIKTDDDEVRFWVREIPKIKAEDNDTELMQKLVDEIPAFLSMLSKRPMATEKLFRSWFHPPLLVTEALQEVRRHSAPNAQRQIEDWLRPVFLASRDEEIMMTTKDLKAEIFRNNSTVEAKWINELVEEHMGVKRYEKNGQSATRAYSYKRIVEKKSDLYGISQELEEVRVKIPARPFVFPRTLLYTDAEWEMLKPDPEVKAANDKVPAMATAGGEDDEPDDMPF